MTALLSWITPATVAEVEKLRITQSRLNEIEIALENFRVKYGRLPCAASSILSDTSPLVFEENCTGVAGLNKGVLPAKTLGINRDIAVDGWGRRFTYQVANSICDVEGTGATLNCTPTDYNDNNGNITITKATASVPAEITTEAAYVIISHGANGNGAYLSNGEQRSISIGTTNESENLDNDNIFWVDPVGSQLNTSGGYEAGRAKFDDIIRFKTKSQIEYRIRDTAKIEIAFDATSSSALELIYCHDITTNDYNSVSEIIEKFDSATNTSVNSAFAAMTTDYFAPFNAGDRILGVLWQLQEVCAKYYPAEYASANIRKCPSGRVYNSSTRSCACPTGQTWSGTQCL